MQKFEEKNQKIRNAFLKLKKEEPERFRQQLNFSWSNWGFGLENLEDSAKRLSENNICYVELHGNHYGSDLGYRPSETKNILDAYGIKVSGVCGMFSADNDLASNRPVKRQAAVDYLKREIEFTAEMGGTYLLVVPAAVGRPQAYDNAEIYRSVETLNLVADQFINYHVRGAVEPIRSAETSIVHTFAEAKQYIALVNHPGIRHINGDVFHMQTEEPHIGNAIIDAGEMLTNLHLADSNRCALGEGSLDLDTIIMALYLIGYNQDTCYVTPEPLGPGGDPYPAMNGIPDPVALDKLVHDSVNYFREREKAVLAL